MPTKIARRAGHLTNFFRMFRVCLGFARGGGGGGGRMLASGIDSHIKPLDAAFIRGRRLLLFFSLKCGVYSRAPFMNE